MTKNNAKLRIIHVDDSIMDRELIADILLQMDDVEYLGGFNSAETAYDFLSRNEADVIILDIELPGADGLRLAQRLASTPVQIAFLTAHPEYAVAAFDVFALHYLVKPVIPGHIARVLERIRHIQESNSLMQAKQLQEFMNTCMTRSSAPSKIFIRNLHETLIINLEEVMYFSARRSCTEFQMTNGEKITSSKNLKVYSDFIQANCNFVRIHRSHVINKLYIKALVQKGHNISLVMKNGTPLEVSFFRKDEILGTIER
jgi:two-component system LytT family response regulator